MQSFHIYLEVNLAECNIAYSQESEPRVAAWILTFLFMEYSQAAQFYACQKVAPLSTVGLTVRYVYIRLQLKNPENGFYCFNE